MPLYEQSLAWYEEQGYRYREGKMFMQRQIKKLRKYRAEVEETALHRYLAGSDLIPR
jgi:hypothetical protein